MPGNANHQADGAGAIHRRDVAPLGDSFEWRHPHSDSSLCIWAVSRDKRKIPPLQRKVLSDLSGFQ